MTKTATFDAASYKATTQAQWDQAAEAWHRWGRTLEQWLGPATELMLDAAEVRPGAAVLDVAAGAGGQTLAAARRVGEHGRVLATDISAGILEYAAEQARNAGLVNIDTRQLDGERLDVPAASFDAVISRVGFIYFPDEQAAFAGMLRALRPGGRLAGVVYSTPEANGFFSIPVSVIRTRARCRRPRPVSPAHSASARPASPTPPWSRPASSTSPSHASTRRCGCLPPPTASTLSGSPSVPCTRCCPGSTRPRSRQPGTRSPNG